MQSAVSFALEFGFTVALTLFVGVRGGGWADTYFGLAPLFTLLGIFLSLGLSGFWTYRKLRSMKL